jgi:hypothetical protein
MRTMAVLLVVCFVALSRLGTAFCADFGPISIAVPEGFDGPLSSAKDGGATTAWVKHHTDSSGGTLLQITTYNAGSALKGITATQRADGAKKYLLDFIGAVAQRRENFKLGAVEPLSLGGLPAARVRWTGTIGDESSIGVMYCVLVDTTIVSFHTQDTGSELTTSMRSAMAAIEGVRTH